MQLNSKKLLFLLSSFAYGVCSTSVFAITESSYLVKENPNPGHVDNYWTPERMEKAKPFPIPTVTSQSVKALPLINLQQQQAQDPDHGDGSPPVLDTVPDVRQLIKSSVLQKIFKSNPTTHSTFDRGGLGQNFSSSRLIPLSADRSYPYSTVGKLFFTTPNGDFVCSASTLRPRVILTAGHCVHSGTGGQAGFYSNWKFVPAYRDGAAPYQTWDWSYVIVTGTWAFGGGGVPNAADYAMIEPQDTFYRDSLRTLGSVTGWLGWQTLSLMPNHAHLLGYPCNLDSCQKMHQVTAQSARAISPNNVEYGSDMRGGSSGGPWVQNFGEFASGQTGGTNSGLNRIIGVTSYLYNDASQMSEGSSIPDGRFINLLTTICARRNGNC